MQGTLWTEEEMKLVNDYSLSDVEVAKKVNRTANAVKLKRYYIKKTSGVKTVAKKEKETKSVITGMGARIRALRLKKELSRYELGAMLGYTSRKSAGNNVCQFENGTRVPTDEKIERLCEIFGVTKDYILTGKEDGKKEEKVVEEPKKEVVTKPDPQPVKTAMLNHEGYVDPTATKAMAIVMNNRPSPSVGNKVLPKHDPKPGEVYEVLNCNTPLLVIGKAGDNVLMTNLFTRPNHNDIYTVKIDLDRNYYINFSKLFTRKIIDLIDKVGEIDISTMDRIKKRYAADFGIGLSEKQSLKQLLAKVNEKPDAATLRFIDSVQYFNEKNKTEFIVPGGCLTLQKAIDISEQMEISLTELLKDHSQDRVLDEICVLEERLKTLKESIGLND